VATIVLVPVAVGDGMGVAVGYNVGIERVGAASLSNGEEDESLFADWESLAR